MKFFKGMARRIFPAPERETEGLPYWREKILSTILLTGVVAAPVVILFVVPHAAKKGLWSLVACDIFLWGFVLFLLLAVRLAYTVRAALALFVTYLLGVVILFHMGVASGGPAWLFSFSVLAGVLLGPRAAVAAVCLNALTVFIGIALRRNGYLDPGTAAFNSPSAMMASAVDYLFLNGLAAVSVSALVKGLSRSHHRAAALADDLGKKQVLLETQTRDRRDAEAALGRSEEKYKTILESMDDAYFEVDLAGNLTFFNTALCRGMGYDRDELLGMNNREYMDAENAERAYEAFNRVYRTGKQARVINWEYFRKDGTRRHAETVISLLKDDLGQPVGFRGLSRDITERIQMEMRLRQTHKMESIGRLSGGIAHDFNNILYIIMGNAELAMDGPHASGPVAEAFERIKTACQRAAAIVSQLLDFSKDQGYGAVLKPVDLTDLVRQEIRFLSSSLPAFIDIRGDLPEAPVYVTADPVQIKQVLLNLSTNGVNAMANQGGTLDIGVKAVTLPGDHVPGHLSLPSGEYGQVCVTDTGRGIPSDHLEKIFDPYFTTREVGEGSGMGLSVVHGIVRQHNGAVSVDSNPGSGTTFKVWIPLSLQPVETAAVEDETPSVPGEGSLLFVDDEEMVVKTHEAMLTRKGYRVAAFTDPQKALAHFRSQPNLFNCLVTDMTMPGMSGVQLAKAAREIRPDLPVIVCTGHSDLAGTEQAKAMGISQIIAKPLTIQELLDAIQSAMKIVQRR